MDAIALARRIKQQILPMLDVMERGAGVPSLELSLRLTRIGNAANEIELKLVEAGPQDFMDENDIDQP
jgi:hypothetical protein